MTELVVVIGLIGILTGIFLYMYSRSRSVVVEDQQTAAYYQSMGLFLETFQSDVRMARRVTATQSGCFIQVMSKSGPLTIAYDVYDSGIRRTDQSGSRNFHFGQPLKSGAKMIFKITSEATE